MNKRPQHKMDSQENVDVEQLERSRRKVSIYALILLGHTT